MESKLKRNYEADKTPEKKIRLDMAEGNCYSYKIYNHSYQYRRTFPVYQRQSLKVFRQEWKTRLQSGNRLERIENKKKIFEILLD